MNRSVFAPALSVILCAAVASAAFAQTKPTPPQPATAPAPAALAKWVAPVKGIASIQVIKGDSKKVGNDIVTVVKVKNMSSGAIALLRADESWYDKKTRQVVTGDTYRHMKPLLPGEIVEMTLRSPFKPDLYASRIDFSHANGKIEAKAVKKFE